MRLCAWNGHVVDADTNVVEQYNGLTIDRVCERHLSTYQKSIKRLAENADTQTTQLFS